MIVRGMCGDVCIIFFYVFRAFFFRIFFSNVVNFYRMDDLILLLPIARFLFFHNADKSNDNLGSNCISIYCVHVLNSCMYCVDRILFRYYGCRDDISQRGEVCHRVMF